METISTEVIELTDGSEVSKDLQKSRKTLEKQSVIMSDTDKKENAGR